MKNKIQIALTLVALVSIMLVGTVGAQYTGYSWSTTYQVVNMGTGDAQVTVDYYDASGNPVGAAQKTFTLGAGKSQVVVQFTDDPNLGTGKYSAVISSNQPVAAVVNQQLVDNTITTAFVSKPPFSSYSGASAGSNTVTLPQVMSNWFGYNTDIIIQNVGSAAATNISIAYTPTSIGGQVTGATGQSDTIASLAQYASVTQANSGESKLYAPASSTFVGRFFGAATITSPQPIVAVVNQQKIATSGTVPAGKLMTYNGFAAGATTTFVPQHLQNWFGYYGSLTIANPGGSAADVTITYTPDTSFSQMASQPAAFSVTMSVPAAGSVNRYDGPGATAAQSDLVTKGFTQFIGGVKVDSASPVIVQENLETPKQAGAYNGVASTDATTTLVVPLIQADFYGFYTSLNIQNVTSSDGTCQITYFSDGTYSSVKNASKTYSHTIKANSTLTVYENANQGDIHMDPTPWTAGGNRLFIGSATAVCTMNVVGFVNSEENATKAPVGDAFYTFNTFNK